MYRFFSSGVPRMASGVGSMTRPAVVMAAAALATAATSAVCFTDKLHPLVPTILFHAGSSSLLSSAAASAPAGPLFSAIPCSSSSLHSSARGNLSIDTPSFSLTSSVPAVRRGVNSTSLMGSVRSVNHLVSHSFLSAGLCSMASSGAISPLLNSFAPLRPAYLYSAFESPKDEIHAQFKAYTTKLMRHSSFTQFSTSPRAMASLWSVNATTFDTFDLSFHLASFFTTPVAPQAPPPTPLTVSPKNLHKWHKPSSEQLNPDDDDYGILGGKPGLTVVLLGWLGSQQKHLRKYAEWYNARGINAVTFTLPMADIISLSVASKADDHVEHLTNQLSSWLAEETEVGQKGIERQLIFHTFSNTGWLTYGVVLEKLSSKGNLVDRIKGCVVDSAPAADLDPQVWASGFSAALLKKRSSTADGNGGMRDSGFADARHPVFVEKSKPRIGESAFLALLEKFFVVFLQIPAINNRLSEVITVLSKEQPPCPQLYIYSTADKVIPSIMVESFMEQQRQQGRIVKGCNFQSSPHVDHFRSFPEIYSRQVSSFLQECLDKSFSKKA